MTDTTKEQPASVDALQRVQPIDGQSLVMWVVYREPADMPGLNFVARKWEIRPGVPAPVATDITMAARELNDIRALLAGCGFDCLARYENDDPVIVETWL